MWNKINIEYNRLYQLDALRGLAAFSVVIHRCLLVLQPFLDAHNHQEITIVISTLTHWPLLNFIDDFTKWFRT
jgi:surface polysaccharide O-acyltransferase-like enzyme